MIKPVVQQAVLRVGIDDAPPSPMQIGDPTLSTLRGYEVDLMERVAERLSCHIEYRRAYWSLITEELKSGHLDLVCSAATVTEEREREVSFCKPHLRLKLALVHRQDRTEASNLVRVRFGVRKGTTAEEFLRRTFGQEPKMLSESNDELYTALSGDKLDAVIDDSPIAMHFAAAIPGLIYGGAYEGTDAAYAIMVGKDNNALLSDINDILLALEKKDVLASSREHWFGTRALLVA